MRKIEIPERLLEFMFQRDKITFVNDFKGWGPEADIEGFTREDVPEGHVLVATATGQTYEHQYVYLRRANHLTVRLDERTDEGWDTVEKLKFSELPLFEEFDVVIQTANEAIEAIVPVCETKIEVVTYLTLVKNYFDKMVAAGIEVREQRLIDIQDLTMFLYKNNPKKREERSFLDNL